MDEGEAEILVEVVAEIVLLLKFSGEMTLSYILQLPLQVSVF